MMHLAAAAITFFLFHRLISGSSLRDVIVKRIGETSFRRLFSLASLLCLAWLWIGFVDARENASQVTFYAPAAALVAINVALQFLATFLIVAGLSRSNPTIAGQGALVQEADIVRGILRITRHPFLWGVSIFSAGHMLVAPNAASWGFFGTLLLLALTGTRSIDSKRQRAWGSNWNAFVARTSNVPFGAILMGRQQLRLSELGIGRVLVAVAVFAGLALSHPVLFGSRVSSWS